MKFTIIKRYDKPPFDVRNEAFLTWDNWNDFNFLTLFGLLYVDVNSVLHNIGAIKIGYFGQGEKDRILAIGDTFEQLGVKFFSLGQDDSYYEKLNALGDSLRDEILNSLNDLAKQPELLDKAIEERVTIISLLRNISLNTVKGQFKRLASGGVRLTSYNFTFSTKYKSVETSRLSLGFSVEPDSNPPTNIHILIGRNGVGKTHLINSMIDTLFNKEPETESSFDIQAGNLFANLILVSFSAFDLATPKPQNIHESNIGYNYIGLKKWSTTNNRLIELKTIEELSEEFITSLSTCIRTSKDKKWHDAILALESDPNFKEANVRSLLEIPEENEYNIIAQALFTALSSGHKIILLTITRLVESIQEKSLVFIDEPEAHLHPPLLSAFTRALSELLINTNGVAIIATHSPVILQEAPSSCVWKLRRSGNESVAERLEIESFGENVGVLTREVFGLEVTESGFYKLLSNTVDRNDSYEQVIEIFNGQLGMEARSIIRALFANKYLTNN